MQRTMLFGVFFGILWARAPKTREERDPARAGGLGSRVLHLCGGWTAVCFQLTKKNKYACGILKGSTTSCTGQQVPARCQEGLAPLSSMILRGGGSGWRCAGCAGGG